MKTKKGPTEILKFGKFNPCKKNRNSTFLLLVVILGASAMFTWFSRTSITSNRNVAESVSSVWKIYSITSAAFCVANNSYRFYNLEQNAVEPQTQIGRISLRISKILSYSKMTSTVIITGYFKESKYFFTTIWIIFLSTLLRHHVYWLTLPNSMGKSQQGMQMQMQCIISVIN